MKFLYPEFLWAFTALIIPIVIHLFNFKRYKTLYFSSLQFVKHVDQKTKSVQRLKHLLILASRLLAFIFLVLAFAQPYFNGAASEDEKKENVVMMFIDNSFSMQARGVEGELLSQARESARSIIQEASRGTQFVIGTNEMSGIEQRKLNAIEALEKLDNIDYSPLVRSLEEVTNWQAQTIRKLYPEDSTVVIQNVILSDFQRIQKEEKSTESLKQFSVYPIQLAPERNENVYIDSVWFADPIRRTSTTNELFMRVVNKSQINLQNVEVVVKMDGITKSFYTDVPAMQSKSTSITYTDRSAGFKKGQITVVDNHVLFDDTYFLSYEVKTGANVLVVNAEDAIPNVEIVLGLENYYKVSSTQITSITLDDLKNKDLVIINGANEVPSGVQNYLLDFSESGGAIALFPGKSANRQSWNQFLGKMQLPLMGATVTSGTKIKSLNFDDPFIKGVLEKRSDRLNLPAVTKAIQPIIGGTSNFNELIKMQNGLPLFGYSNGTAKTYMFYGTLHPDWGNISRDALFSTMILRISELSQRLQPLSLTIGEQGTFPLYSESENEQALHLSTSQFDFIPQTTVKSGVRYISLNQFDNYQQLVAGNYTIKDNRNRGVLSINYSRIESVLDYQTEAEITDFFTNKGAVEVSFKQVDGVNTPLNDLRINKPFSYWKICIILTLIFVLIEMLLVRFLKQ